LQALGGPANDGGKAAELETFLGQLAALTHGLGNAALAGDRAQVVRVTAAVGSAADHYTSAARAYGLRSCGGIAQLAVARRGNR